MPRKPPAVLSHGLSQEALGIFADLDGGEGVTDKEAAAVLLECLPEPPKPKSRASPPLREPPRPREATLGSRIDERMAEYNRNAATARSAGRHQEALAWLGRAKELTDQVCALLADSSGQAVSSDDAHGATSTIKDAFAHIVSMRVVELEATRLRDANDAGGLALLKQHRQALLSTKGTDGGVTYRERLKMAIECEKTRSRLAKQDGDTAAALSALRRAKCMSDEMEELGNEEAA